METTNKGWSSTRDRSSGVRLSELMAVLSLSADLGLGQPMEHVLRSCLISVRLAERLDLSAKRQAETYWVTLLGTVCTGESHELVDLFGDDITFRAGLYRAGTSTVAELGYLLRTAGTGKPAAARARTAAGLVLTGGKALQVSMQAHTAVTAQVSHLVGLDPDIATGLSHRFARWDGKGVPRGVRSDAIAISARLLQLADLVEVAHREQGLEAATTMARRLSGRLFDPAVVDAFCRDAAEIVADLDDEVTWDAMVAAEPLPRPALTEAEFDAVLEVLADVADLKSPWFSGHSRGVSELAARAANVAGLPHGEVTTLRRAALVHDLGRTGVSTAIWDKPGPLTASEKERVRLHTYYTERMLRRPGALAEFAVLASSSHERVDGSGYHRGVAGGTIPVLARFLAAADVYHAMLEDRPHRPALTRQDASTQLREGVRRGELGGAAVDAVLSAAGHRKTLRPSAPAGLTVREMEVLALVARGASTRQVAQTLDIAPKTASNHIERIYLKIGATSRSTATLYAMQHGLVPTLESVGS
ncbi:MAG: HD domain-containing phosphohydrolase [Actinomycetes bacterium]